MKEKQINIKKINQKLGKLISKDMTRLSDKELDLLVFSGKCINDFLGYPIATMSSGSAGESSIDIEKETGKMLLKNIHPGMGEEFIEDASKIGGLGLAAIMGLANFSENLGSTALTALALGGMFGMSLLPPPSMFGNYFFYGLLKGLFICPLYYGAKSLPEGDNMKNKNSFLSEGPMGTCPVKNLEALLSGFGRKTLKEEKCSFPGALPGFCGKYGYY